MQSKMTGPVAAFTGAMTAPVTRKVTAIQVVEAATFTILDPMFQGATVEGEEVPITDLTYPPLFMLENIKKFQLASGSILVAFGGDQ